MIIANEMNHIMQQHHSGLIKDMLLNEPTSSVQLPCIANIMSSKATPRALSTHVTIYNIPHVTLPWHHVTTTSATCHAGC